MGLRLSCTSSPSRTPSSGSTEKAFGNGSNDCGTSLSDTSHCNSDAAGCFLLANFCSRLLATASADRGGEALDSMLDRSSKAGCVSGTSVVSDADRFDKLVICSSEISSQSGSMSSMSRQLDSA